MDVVIVADDRLGPELREPSRALVELANQRADAVSALPKRPDDGRARLAGGSGY